MPTFRPDLFGERTNRNLKVIGQIAVEAEIPKTLFSSHTEHQLLMMHEYLLIQRGKRIPAEGFLIVPSGKETLIEVKMRLYSLFPAGTSIQYIQFSV